MLFSSNLMQCSLASSRYIWGVIIKVLNNEFKQILHAEKPEKSLQVDGPHQQPT